MGEKRRRAGLLMNKTIKKKITHFTEQKNKRDMYNTFDGLVGGETYVNGLMLGSYKSIYA